MRFFHLSDLHLGLKLMNHDLLEDQRFILEQIVALAREEQPDAVVIAGDLYDKAIPSADAVALFDDFVTKLSSALPDAQIMMISGNHDSAPRVNIFRHLLERENIHMIGVPPENVSDHIEQVTMTDEYGAVHFYLLPFVRPSMVRAVVGTHEDGTSLSYDETLRRMIAREDVNQDERNILVSHQFYVPVGADPEQIDRMDSEIRTIGNIDQVGADVLDVFDYAALGHIHKPMKVGKERYRYCGTPIACSVSEAGQQKGIVCVELGAKHGVRHGLDNVGSDKAALPPAAKVSDPGACPPARAEIQVRVLPLEPLRQVRVITGTLDEVVTQACDDYVRVVLTDKVDLNVADMQDRVRYAFPHLLEIRRETLRGSQYQMPLSAERMPDTFELCKAFLKDLDEQEQALLRDVINTVKERSERSGEPE